MLRNLLSICFLSLIGLLVFSSCGKEESEVETTEEFVTFAMQSVQEQSNSGKKGCFEIVYPISITFPDATTEEITDLEDLRTTIRTWKENNPDATDKPAINYPIEIITEDGEMLTVTSMEEMKALKRDCRGHHGGKGDCKDCFEIQYPVSLVFPDGTVTEFASRMELKMALRAFKEANPDATERPTLVFPITVLQEDELITVNSLEELQQMKEDCKDD